MNKKVSEEDKVINYLKNNEVLYNSIRASLFLKNIEKIPKNLTELTKIIIKVINNFFEDLNVKIIRKENYLKVLKISGKFMHETLSYNNLGFGVFKYSFYLFIDSFIKDKNIKYKGIDKKGTVELFFYEE